jgi:PhnB protein
MNSKLNPYINFDGNAKEAMEFYTNVFGGKLTMSTFKEGGAPPDPSQDDKIMHAMLVADNGITLMASDTPKGWAYTPGTNISVSLSGDNEAELKGYFDKLSAGAQIEQPLTKAPWGDMFGMLRDKFGIRWMINIAEKKS